MGGARQSVLKRAKEEEDERDDAQQHERDTWDEWFSFLSLDHWSEALTDHVRRCMWMRVNVLLDIRPQAHSKDALLQLSGALLWGSSSSFSNRTALSVFRTLLERCVKNEPSVVMPVARRIVHFGRLEQLRTLLTMEDPAVRRELWDDARNLKRLRTLLVQYTCLGRDCESRSWPMTHMRGEHAACLTLALQQGLFTTTATPPSSSSSSLPNHDDDNVDYDEDDSDRLLWDDSPLYKAVLHNQPDLVHVLYETGEGSPRELLKLVALAERNFAGYRPIPSPAARLEALVNELDIWDCSVPSPRDRVNEIINASAAREILDLLRTADYQPPTMQDLENFVSVAGQRRHVKVVRLLPLAEAQEWYNARFLEPYTEEDRQDAKDILGFLRTAASQPRSLKNLCQLSVSRVVGVGPDHQGRDRLTRIRELGLPATLQQDLSFEDLDLSR